MRTSCVATAAFLAAWAWNGAAAQTPPAKPEANLIQVMRGILFPNSNIIFATQGMQAAEIEKIDVSPGTGFSGVYRGWQVVENAALALSESADLVLKAGRLCEGGRPAPVTAEDWIAASRQVREAGLVAYKAAQSKDPASMVKASDAIADACDACHSVYLEDKSVKERCAH